MINKKQRTGGPLNILLAFSILSTLVSVALLIYGVPIEGDKFRAYIPARYCIYRESKGVMPEDKALVDKCGRIYVKDTEHGTRTFLPIADQEVRTSGFAMIPGYQKDANYYVAISGVSLICILSFLAAVFFLLIIVFKKKI